MDAKLKFASTADEKQTIFRFRYEIYVNEMDRYHGIADHKHRMLIEDVDASSRFLYADLGGEIVGAMRWTWGGDARFDGPHIEQYSLQPFIDTLPIEQMIIGERFMVSRDHRGSDLLSRMFERYMDFCNQHRIQLVFGDCEPHLLNLYLGLGFRTYSERNISNPETGYLIPLVLVTEDIAYMQQIGSPMAKVLKDFGGSNRVPVNLDELIQDSAVLSERLANRETYWESLSDTFKMIGQCKFSLFDNLDKNVIQPFLDKSNVIECLAGDQVLKQGNVAHNMFVVLEGVLEVRVKGKAVARLERGDLLGEVAFLLGNPRSADVYAITDGTTILSLSETTVREHIEEDPKVAAQMMLNIAKILCQKLVA